MKYKIYTKKNKPLYAQGCTIPKDHYWHETTKEFMQSIMPYNDRLDQLIEKIAKSGEPRHFMSWSFKVEKDEPKE